jgi:Fic family protein
LTEDVVKTSELEGEVLNLESVRSSIARRLGVEIGAVAAVDRDVEGVVEMVFDATSRSAEALTAERLFGWHAALFPTGYSGMSKLAVGQWRNDAVGPMQVISGPMERRKVHFQAPPAAMLPAETSRFLAWANEQASEPMLIKAGLAHLWFVTLHPFDDGNGRIARAVGDLFLARADGSTQRFYSLSAQIQRERRGLLRCAGTHAKGYARCDRLAGVVPWHAGPCHRQCADHAGCRADQGTLLATLGRRWTRAAVERAASKAAQPPARWLRRQAHQQQVGVNSQVLTGYRPA